MDTNYCDVDANEMRNGSCGAPGLKRERERETDRKGEIESLQL